MRLFDYVYIYISSIMYIFTLHLPRVLALDLVMRGALVAAVALGSAGTVEGDALGVIGG